MTSILYIRLPIVGIVFQHLEEYSGDHVNLDELSAACRQAIQQ